MTYAFSYDVPGNRTMYNAVKAGIGTLPPEGLRAHLVVEINGGLRHTMVWNSQLEWETFRDLRVTPAVSKVLQAAGIPVPAQPPQVDPLSFIDLWTPTEIPQSAAVGQTTP
jgi:hypothetical protein